MKISRSLFLAMTGAIATGACHMYVDEPNAPPPPPPRAVAYSYGPPPGYHAVRAADGRVYYVRRVVRRPARPVGVATSDPGYRPAPPSLGFTSPPGPSTESGASVAPAPQPEPEPAPPATEGCLDTEAMTVPDCSEVKVDPGCGIRSFVMQRCNTYRTYLDPKVATVAISCMAGLSPKQLCDATNTYGCGKQALSEACADPELSQMCQIAATSCRTTAADCTALLSGLSEPGKQKVAECVAHGCQAGLYSCVEGLH